MRKSQSLWLKKKNDNRKNYMCFKDNYMSYDGVTLQVYFDYPIHKRSKQSESNILIESERVRWDVI